MGFLNLGLAAMDLTGAGALVKGFTVGTMKFAVRKQIKNIYKNTNNWANMRRGLQKAGIIPVNSMSTPRKFWLTTDHIFLKQKSNFSHKFLNHPLNLQINIIQSLNSKFEHMSFLKRLIYLPTWMKLSGTGLLSYSLGLFIDSEGLECN